MSKSDNATSLDIAQAVYFDATTTIRHYDGQRAGFIKISISLISLLLTSAAALEILPSEAESRAPIHFVLGFVVLISALFLAISLKFSILIDRQKRRARASAEKIALLSDTSILEIDSAVRERERSKRRLFGYFRLETLLTLVYGIIALIAVVMSVALAIN